MKTFKQFMNERCWPGHKAVPGKKPYSPGSCKKEDVEIEEASSPAQQAAIAINKKMEKLDKLPKKPKGEYERKVDSYLKKKYNKEEVELDEMFDIVEDMVTEIAQLNNVDPEVIWEDFETIPDEELYEVAAWQRKEGKSESGGLNRKGIMSYRRENPGSKLSMAVTTKPSKLKKGSKAANRRKSFCARMGGMKKRLTSAKTARDPNSRINKALRKWNC